jgi:uncharacterized protein (TIGR02246 family)
MPARTPEETHAVIEAAFNAGDLEAFVAAFEPDAVMVNPPDGRTVRGRAEIREAARPVVASRPTARMEVLRKLESDGLALTFARWTVTGTGTELSGEGTIVSRRQPDGTWLILLDCATRPSG